MALIRHLRAETFPQRRVQEGPTKGRTRRQHPEWYRVVPSGAMLDIETESNFYSGF